MQKGIESYYQHNSLYHSNSNTVLSKVVERNVKTDERTKLYRREEKRFCVCTLDGTVCSMRMFIYFRSFVLCSLFRFGPNASVQHIVRLAITMDAC